MMKTDIEIAQEAVMKPITEVAAALDITQDELELYGKYKAKLSSELWEKIKDRKDGKLVLVTAINPTPAGEGKTTTTVGLGEAMAKLGKKAVIALREPSLGPCFGIKGGAAGGGYAQVVPMEDLNLHFTGDFHAITSANNLLAALLDNHIQQGNALNIDTRQIVWKRCLDMNDRVLRNIVVGLGSKMDGFVREDHFVITVASEIMAILCLADDLADLKRRLGRIIVAYNDKIAYEETLADCLISLFGTKAQNGVSGSETTTPSQSGGEDSAANMSARQLAELVQEYFTKAQNAQKNGDWAKYGEYLDKMEEYLNELTK